MCRTARGRPGARAHHPSVRRRPPGRHRDHGPRGHRRVFRGARQVFHRRRGDRRGGFAAEPDPTRPILTRRCRRRAGRSSGRRRTSGNTICRSNWRIRAPPVKMPGHPEVAADFALIFGVAPLEVVYLHNPADKHDTHVALLLRCLEALRALPAARRPRRVLGCEVWRDLDWLVDADKVALDAGRARRTGGAAAPRVRLPNHGGQALRPGDGGAPGGQRDLPYVASHGCTDGDHVGRWISPRWSPIRRSRSGIIRWPTSTACGRTWRSDWRSSADGGF